MLKSLERFGDFLAFLQKKSNLEEKLSHLIRQLVNIVNPDSCSIILRKLHFDYYGVKINRNLTHHRVKELRFYDKDAIVKEMRSGKLIHFYQKDNERFRIERPYSHLICAPIIYEDMFFGFAHIDRKQGSFTDEDILTFQLLCQIASFVIALDVIKNKYEQSKEIDEITHINTYSSFYHHGKAIFAQMKRYKRELSLIVMEIEHYEEMIRRFGTEKSNKVISEFANAMKNNVRTIELLGKIDVNTFAILLPETSIEGTKVVVERLNKILSNILADCCKLSWGISAINQAYKTDTFDDLLLAAEAAQFSASRKYTNKVEVYQSGASSAVAKLTNKEIR